MSIAIHDGKTVEGAAATVKLGKIWGEEPLQWEAEYLGRWTSSSMPTASNWRRQDHQSSHVKLHHGVTLHDNPAP
jgi:hypothetical protein